MEDLLSVQRNFEANGFFQSNIIADGKVHRFQRVSGDKKKNAWYICFAHPGFLAGSYGDWSTGEKHNFCTNISISGADKEKVFKRVEKKFEEEQALVQLESAKDSQEFIQEFAKTGSGLNEYLTNKKITGYHGALSSSGDLIIPMQDVDGVTWGFQRIQPDGKKIFSTGLKKRGSFFAIGPIEADSIYFCEGFATGCSIHEATKKTVIVCFDAGNLQPVIESFRKKYEEKKFIICGDDDFLTDGNPGKAFAERAASAGLASVVFPKFKSQITKPTDFNDLHCLEGLSIVAEQILGTSAEVLKHTALGFSPDGTYFYTTSKNKSIIALKAHTNSDLFRLLPLSYWESKFSKQKGGVDWDRARSTLMNECHAKGIYSSKNHRRFGAWDDQGRTVVHLGNRLWVDGNEIEFHDFKTNYIYELREALPSLEAEPLSSDEIKPWLDTLARMSFKDPSDYFQLTGWLGLASVCGFLPWRTHFWVNGERGSGKTALFQHMNFALSSMNACIYKTQKTTEAALRNETNACMVPVLIDEAEGSKDQKEATRVGNILDLFRQASSDSEASVSKGTPGHISLNFRPKFAGGLGSIDFELSNPADRSRFVLINMDVPTHSTNEWLEIDYTLKSFDAVFFRRLFTRLILQKHTIQQNFKTIKTAFQEFNACDGRTADKYGVILTGRAALLYDRPISNEEAMGLVYLVDLGSDSNNQSSGEASERLAWLMTVKIRFETMEKSIFELYKGATKEHPSYKAVLARHGIHIIENDAIFISSNRHSELDRIIASSPWKMGFREGLKKIKGVDSIQRPRIDGKRPRGLTIPAVAISAEN